jgi:hypothetical protein
MPQEHSKQVERRIPYAKIKKAVGLIGNNNPKIR